LTDSFFIEMNDHQIDTSPNFQIENYFTIPIFASMLNVA